MAIYGHKYFKSQTIKGVFFHTFALTGVVHALESSVCFGNQNGFLEIQKKVEQL